MMRTPALQSHTFDKSWFRKASASLDGTLAKRWEFSVVCGHERPRLSELHRQTCTCLRLAPTQRHVRRETVEDRGGSVGTYRMAHGEPRSRVGASSGYIDSCKIMVATASA
jgi:hypothetical protein